MSNVVSQIANAVLVVLIFPISYLVVVNLIAFLKPSRLKKQQKERDNNSCRIHTYKRVGHFRMCTDCGYCPENKFYFNTDKIQLQLDLNVELKQLEAEKDKKIDEIIDSYGIKREALDKLTDEMSAVLADLQYKKSKKMKDYLELAKEQGLDNEV